MILVQTWLSMNVLIAIGALATEVKHQRQLRREVRNPVPGKLVKLYTDELQPASSLSSNMNTFSY